MGKNVTFRILPHANGEEIDSVMLYIRGRLGACITRNKSTFTPAEERTRYPAEIPTGKFLGMYHEVQKAVYQEALRAILQGKEPKKVLKPLAGGIGKIL